MRVVVMGGRDRREKDDYVLVNALLDYLKKKYPVLLIVTTGCDRGVGKIVNNRLMPSAKHGKPEINYIEWSFRIEVDRELPKLETTAVFLAKNATLVELGDEFHLFVEEKPIGVAEDLRQRCAELQKPHVLYRMGVAEPEYVYWPTGSPVRG